jgi:hypothetical protein
MFGAVIGIGLLLGLIAAASSKARASSLSAPAPAGNAALKKIVASGNPKAIAAAAVEVHKAGDPKLAAALAKHARSAAVTSPTAAYKSPFPGVDDLHWSLFVRALRGKDPKAITPNYYLGLFGFGMRRLVDLGLATNPHKIDHNGKQVWGADWVPALSPGPEKFLGDADLQYKTFSKSMLNYGKQIARDMPEAVGSTLDGKTVTLSGLLAVCKQAGFEGLKAWAADEAVRASHHTTTALFEKLNGIF